MRLEMMCVFYDLNYALIIRPMWFIRNYKIKFFGSISFPGIDVKDFKSLHVNTLNPCDKYVIQKGSLRSLPLSRNKLQRVALNHILESYMSMYLMNKCS